MDVLETIYMDYNATTPIREEVMELMSKVARECYGNPSSVHLPGRISKACLEDARRKVAESIEADSGEICFTNGGSESGNLAIKGVAATRQSGHIITTCIEHSAVRHSCDYLKTQGFDVTCLLVDNGGYVVPESIEAASRTAVEEVRPLDDVRASAGYRSHCVHVLTRRLLTRAWERLAAGDSQA